MFGKNYRQVIAISSTLGLGLFTPAFAQQTEQSVMVPEQSSVSAAEINTYFQPAQRNPLVTTPQAINQLPAEWRSVEAALNLRGYSLLNPDEVWESRPLMERSLLKRQAAQFGHTDKTYFAADPKLWTKSWEAGWKSALWGKASLRLQHSGSSTLARIQGEARVEGAILNHSKTLFLATADVKAPATGNQSAALRLDVMGKTIWSKSQTASTVNLTAGKSYSARFWQFGIDVPIVDWVASGEVWLFGEVGVQVVATATPLKAEITAGPYAKVGLGGRAKLDVGLAYVKARGEVNFIELYPQIGAKTEITSDPLRARKYLNGSRWVNLYAEFLSGYFKVSAYLRNPFGSDPRVGTWTLWDDPDGLFHVDAKIINESFRQTISDGGIRK